MNNPEMADLPSSFSSVSSSSVSMSIIECRGDVATVEEAVEKLDVPAFFDGQEGATASFVTAFWTDLMAFFVVLETTDRREGDEETESRRAILQIESEAQRVKQMVGGRQRAAGDERQAAESKTS
jgi:hypothetical protein